MSNNAKPQVRLFSFSSAANRKFLAITLGGMLCLGLAGGVQAEESWAPNVFNFQLTMAERGHVEAQYLLAGMYAEGHGTERDMELALQWYQKAAANGHSDAQQRLLELKGKGA